MWPAIKSIAQEQTPHRITRGSAVELAHFGDGLQNTPTSAYPLVALQSDEGRMLPGLFCGFMDLQDIDHVGKNSTRMALDEGTPVHGLSILEEGPCAIVFTITPADGHSKEMAGFSVARLFRDLKEYVGDQAARKPLLGRYIITCKPL